MIEVQNEVLRKIGRNVVLFQELEVILKFLAINQRSSSPVRKLQADLENRTAAVQGQTLGQVSGWLLKNLYADSTGEPSTPDKIVESWVSFKFQIDAAPESNRNSLGTLVKDRNQLIHGLLAGWNPNDIESCQALSVELDEQRARIVLEIERYRTYANCLKETAAELRAFVDSDEGKGQFDLACLQQSPLVAMLTEIARGHARQDGWTLISTAGSRLNQRIPNEFARMKTMHRFSSLQKLIVATNLFDVCSERTGNGGTRALYRLRASGDA